MSVDVGAGTINTVSFAELQSSSTAKAIFSGKQVHFPATDLADSLSPDQPHPRAALLLPQDRGVCRFLIVSVSTCLSDVNRLTPSVIEVTSDGGIQLAVGIPSALIQQARDKIERVGRENSPRAYSPERIVSVGRMLCHPSVWVTATASPIGLCPNHDCGGRHILADCRYPQDRRPIPEPKRRPDVHNSRKR